MLCLRCEREIPDGSLFCSFCGYKQKGKPKRRTIKRRRAKGSGCIIQRKGLKKPFLARFDGAYLGYYATPEEAEAALAAAKEKGPDLAYNGYTMQHVFDAITSERDWQTKTPKYRSDTLSSWKYMTELHNKKAKDVRKEDFQDIIYRAQDEGKSKSHQDKLRVLARKLCLWCVQHGIHKTDYSAGLKINNNIKRERASFTDKELQLFYEHREERAPAIIWFLCLTGCRPADLAKIRRDDRIDMKRKGIWLEGSKTAAGKNRFIAVDPETWEIFMRFYNSAFPGDFIFKSKNGFAWDTNNFLKNEFYPTLDALGIPREKYVLYSCRHTFATLAERSGVDKATLQRAMGHEIGSTVTDDHYIDQVAHVDTALIEFSKIAAQVKKITG